MAVAAGFGSPVVRLHRNYSTETVLCTDCTPPLKAITLLVPVTYLDRLLQNLTALRPSDFTEAMQENARTSKGKHSYTYRGNKPARKGAV